MIFPGIRKLARKLGFHASVNQVFGIHKGYFVTMGDGRNLKYVSIETGTLDDMKKRAIEAVLAENKSQYKYSKHSLDGDRVYLEFSEILTPFPIKKIEEALDFAADLLARESIAPTNRCSSCNGESEVDFYTFGPRAMRLCGSCVVKMADDTERSAADFRREPKFYLRGALGAFLCAIPGVVLGVIVYVFLQRIASITALAISGLALWGYRAFKGKMGPFAPVIIIATSVVFIFIYIYVSLVFVMMKEGLPLDFVLRSLPALLENDGELRSAVLQDLFMSYMLALLVWVPMFINLVRGAKSVKLKKALPV